MSGNGVMKSDPYLAATRAIPRGETRTFRELAALAQRPLAARAAGRAIASCPADAAVPWQRVIAADGSLSKQPERAELQLARLRREGARPRAGESIARWAKRRGAACVGNWRMKRFAASEDARAQAWPADKIEAFRDAAQALERGFVAVDAAASGAPLPARVARRRVRAVRVEPSSPAVLERFASVDWKLAARELATRGAFTIERLLDSERCRALCDAWTAPELYERAIDMAPRGYGVGTYRYFKEPLPEPAFTIRDALYSRFLPLARTVPSAPEYPPTLAEFFERCRSADQRRGSSICLTYGAGGVNHPHRDIYGKLWFPYQAVLVLSARGVDFDGGELVLSSPQRDGSERRRSVLLDRGDLCVFAARGYWESAPDDTRPRERTRAPERTRAGGRASRSPREQKSRAQDAAAGARGRWVELKHGLSPITRGARCAVGIVLHLAQ
jgi:alkylated DNA nucleotide flippase Atl1